MADDNRVSAEITPAVQAQIQAKIVELGNLLPFRVHLTADETHPLTPASLSGR